MPINTHAEAVKTLNVISGKTPGYWNVYVQSGVCRIYLDYVSGTKTEAVNKARKMWPGKNIFLTPNRSIGQTP